MTLVNMSILNDLEQDSHFKEIEIAKDVVEEFEEDPDFNQLNEPEIIEYEHHKEEQPSIEEKQIENFILGKTIGQGSFGKVKIGTHVLTKEKVAVKIMDKSRFDQDDYKNIKKEISVMKRIKHKNIIQFYELIETEDKMYIVMEFAEGGDFFEFISKNIRLSDEKLACKYFQQIINALEYMHSMNIVHRDIKPENMLLDFKQEIKITDFGLSTVYRDDQLLTTPCGTPTYAPPELIKGEEYHGMFSDIWSAGVVLYAMLCGYLPFGESNEMLLQRHILRGDFELPEFLSEDAKELLKGVLKVDPLERFDFEQIKASKWFNSVNYVFYPGIFIEKHIFPVDDKILDLIENIYNMDKKAIRFHLLNHDFNDLTTTFYMMLKRYIKEGGKSISDLFSKEYLDYIQDPKNMYNHSTDFLEISKEHDPMNTSDIHFVNQLIKDSTSRLSTIKVQEISSFARKSLNLYYHNSNKDKPNEMESLIETEMRQVNVPRKTVFRRTDGVASNMFLDLLERKTLKLAENESIDCEKLLEDYMKKKNFLEAHQRNSVRFNFDSLGVIKDEISDNASDSSKNISQVSENQDEDLKNINVDAVYEVPQYLEEKKSSIKKTKKKIDQKKKEDDNKPKRVKIDPKKYNIYLNKKVKKKEKTPERIETKQNDTKQNTIIRINIEFPAKKKEQTLTHENNGGFQINAASGQSKGDTTTRGSNTYRNVLNSSMNDNNTLQTDENENILRTEQTTCKPSNNENAINLYKKKGNTNNNKHNSTSKSKNQTNKSTSRDASYRRNNNKSHNKTISHDAQPSFKPLSTRPAFNYQLKPVSKSPNKPNGDTSRSKSPTFNAYSTLEQARVKIATLQAGEYSSYFSNHNNIPYSTKKARIDYTPIRTNIIPEKPQPENTSINNTTDTEEVKIRLHTGPIDLNCCIPGETDTLVRKIVKILNRHRIIYINKNVFCYRCNKEGIKFKISLHSLKDSKLLYTRFQRVQGTSLEFHQVVSKILSELKLNV